MTPAPPPSSPCSLVGAKALRMNGAGNKIVVLDLRRQRANAGVHSGANDGADKDACVKSWHARAIAQAKNLDFEQLMVLYPPPADSDLLARVKIFNNDGSLSQACGNGARCVGWVLSQATGRSEMAVESDAGRLKIWRRGENIFTVDMGAPRFDWRAIPLSRMQADAANIILDPPVAGAPHHFSAVSMGNPHAIFFVADAAAVDLADFGPKIEHHPLFPERINVSFAQILDDENIALRVWERGAGATLACGSAACATLVAAHRAGLFTRRAKIHLPGGVLDIQWREDDHVLMTGPTAFEQEVVLEESIFADGP